MCEDRQELQNDPLMLDPLPVSPRSLLHVLCCPQSSPKLLLSPLPAGVMLESGDSVPAGVVCVSFSWERTVRTKRSWFRDEPYVFTPHFQCFRAAGHCDPSPGWKFPALLRLSCSGPLPCPSWSHCDFHGNGGGGSLPLLLSQVTGS